VGYEAAIKDEFLGLVKGFNFQFLKGMPFILHSEVGERVNNLTVVLQEVLVKVAETKE